MIRHVVFDFDGTLVDSNAIKRDAFVEIAAAYPDGHAAMRAVQSDGLPQDRYSVFQRFAERVGGLEEAQTLSDTLVKRYSELCEDRISGCAFCPGGEEVIQRLKGQGLRVYANSATPQAALGAILERRGMLSWFDDFRGLPPGKTENLLDLMRQHGAAAGETLVVGDGADDKASAATAGCHYLSTGCGRPGFDLVNLSDLPDRISALS